MSIQSPPFNCTWLVVCFAKNDIQLQRDIQIIKQRIPNYKLIIRQSAWDFLTMIDKRLVQIHQPT